MGSLSWMTGRERVRAAIFHEIPDRIPLFEQEIASNVASAILGRHTYTCGGGIGWCEIAELLFEGKRDFLVERASRDLRDLYSTLDLDMVRPPLIPSESGGPIKKLDANTYYYKDDDTKTWRVQRFDEASKMFMTIDSSFRREGLQAIERYIEKSLDKPVEIDEDSFDVWDRLFDALGEEKLFTGGGNLAISMDPPWLKVLYQRPDLIEAYLDRMLDTLKVSIKVQRHHGADLILGGGDLADNHGPAFAPSLYRRIFLPRLKELTDFCHSLGLPYIYRTDGYVWPLAKELFVESGVDGYGEIDYQAGMRLSDIKERLPHLILWGNVDCAKTLVLGSKSEVELETRRCIEEGAPGGGYILGSSNTIHPNVVPENFLTMLKTAKSYGFYDKIPQP
ncbi:MAG: uroporphyrinogen decarboxylase family protein [Candidatus Bathyarchaeia archaeon]